MSIVFEVFTHLLAGKPDLSLVGAGTGVDRGMTVKLNLTPDVSPGGLALGVDPEQVQSEVKSALMVLTALPGDLSSVVAGAGGPPPERLVGMAAPVPFPKLSGSSFASQWVDEAVARPPLPIPRPMFFGLLASFRPVVSPSHCNHYYSPPQLFVSESTLFTCPSLIDYTSYFITLLTGHLPIQFRVLVPRTGSFQTSPYRFHCMLF